MRALPDDNLAYPVLVNRADGGSGSAFFINAPSANYLVTAKHVLCNEATNESVAPLVCDKVELLSYGADPDDRVPNVLLLNLQELQAGGHTFLHPEQDVAAIRIGLVAPADRRHRFRLEFLPGVTRKSGPPPSGIVCVGHTFMKMYSDVLVGNDIFIFGYPTSLGVKDIPQIDYSRPLLRKGIVAGKNDHSRTIVLDCPVYPGNSGGLVIQISAEGGITHFNAIGVVIQYVPLAEKWVNLSLGGGYTTLSNSGYSVAPAMDLVWEVIQSAEKALASAAG